MEKTSFPPHVSRDLDILANLMIHFSLHCFQNKGHLYPFGAMIEKDGSPGIISAYPPSMDAIADMTEKPDESHEHEQAAIFYLSMALRNVVDERGLNIAGICCRAQEGYHAGSNHIQSDSVFIHLEHSSGDVVNIAWLLKKHQSQIIFPTPEELHVGPGSDRLVYKKAGKAIRGPSERRELSVIRLDLLRPSQEKPVDFKTWAELISKGGYWEVRIDDSDVKVPIYIYAKVSSAPNQTVEIQAKEWEDFIRKEYKQLNKNDSE